MDSFLELISCDGCAVKTGSSLCCSPSICPSLFLSILHPHFHTNQEQTDLILFSSYQTSELEENPFLH